MEPIADLIKKKYKFAANYGFILGGYIAFFFILDFLVPGFISNVLNMAGFLGTPILCYYLTKNYRDKALGGYIRFGQSWAFGVWLFFFAGLIMSVFYYVRFKFIQPDYLNQAFNQAILMMQQLKYSQQQIDAMLSMGMPSVIQIVLYYLWFFILGGGLLFLFISGFVSKRPPVVLPDQSYEPYDGDQNDNTGSSESPTGQPEKKTTTDNSNTESKS
jgi:hypothetical protein